MTSRHPVSPSLRHSGSFGLYAKQLLVKLVQYMEICALHYIAGIASAVGMAWQFPPHIWALISKLGVLGAVVALYSPIPLLHTAFILHLKNRFPAKREKALFLLMLCPAILNPVV